MPKDSRIGKAIHNSWSHISQDYRATCMQSGLTLDENLILLNNSKCAGFDNDGLNRSVTRNLTADLESVQFKLLKKSVEMTQHGSLGIWT